MNLPQKIENLKLKEGARTDHHRKLHVFSAYRGGTKLESFNSGFEALAELFEHNDYAFSVETKIMFKSKRLSIKAFKDLPANLSLFLPAAILTIRPG